MIPSWASMWLKLVSLWWQPELLLWRWRWEGWKNCEFQFSAIIKQNISDRTHRRNTVFFVTPNPQFHTQPQVSTNTLRFFERLRREIFPDFRPEKWHKQGLMYLSCGFYFRQERRIACYAENEQEAETKVGVVSEWKKSHYLQRTLQKVHRFTLLDEIMYNYKMFFFSRRICKKNTDCKISVLLSSFTYIS